MGIPLFLTCVFALAWSASAQEIRIYSEFQRFDPWGNVLPADKDFSPREVLSPAVPRNGHLSFHVVITGSASTNYFLYVASNPPNILVMNLYREHWGRCGEGVCGDWLTPIQSPSFGAIPESLTEYPGQTQYPGQTTRNYLLDIYVPKEIPPRRVRVEALMKVGIWLVAPLEVRVIEPIVPDTDRLPHMEQLAKVEAQSSATALLQLLRYETGKTPVLPAGLLRVRDVIQRNAAEDMWLAQAHGNRLPELGWMTFWPFTYPQLGAEWYLRVRDFLYRLER